MFPSLGTRETCHEHLLSGPKLGVGGPEKCEPPPAFQGKGAVFKGELEELTILGWPCTNVVWASFLLLNVTVFASRLPSPGRAGEDYATRASK